MNVDYVESLVLCDVSLPTFRIDALKEAISAHQDIEVIRGLFEGGKVPDEVRADLWKVRKIKRENVSFPALKLLLLQLTSSIDMLYQNIIVFPCL